MPPQTANPAFCPPFPPSPRAMPRLPRPPPPRPTSRPLRKRQRTRRYTPSANHSSGIESEPESQSPAPSLHTSSSSSASPSYSPPPFPSRSASRSPRPRRLPCDSDVPAAYLGQGKIGLRKTGFGVGEVGVVRARLLEWYAENYRELPWRVAPGRVSGGVGDGGGGCGAGSAYAVWVSEVMSQQTRLSVVEGYYRRWMRVYPSVAALAEGSLERVNELWAGLGYYRRARFLYEGAKQVVEEYGGIVPGTVEELMGIRGVGRYTAGAIASIAFGKQVPIVDGNVKRVLARLCPGMGGEGGVVGEGKYWEMAEELVRGAEFVGDLNQAVMELGALVCKPRGAECGRCPLRGVCGAYIEAVESGGDVASYVARYPVKDRSKVVKVRDERVAVVVVCVEQGSERWFLIVQRPGDGLLGGLWEAPNVVVGDAGEAGVDEAFERVKVMLRDVPSGGGLGAEVVEPLDKAGVLLKVGTVKHIFSHIRQSLDVRAAVFRHREGKAEMREGIVGGDTPFRWVTEEELKEAAVSTQMKKVFAAAIKRLPTARRIRQ